MTIVVTTASIQGITVVGDRAQSRPVGGAEYLAEPDTTKVFFSAAANLSFALWGNARWPNELGDYGQWFAREVVEPMVRATSLRSACDQVCSKINPVLNALGGDFEALRRGVHVAGYVNDRPHIYHCHTGAPPPEPQHELRVFEDWPMLFAGTEGDYVSLLRNGPLPQLRNGRYDLFVLTKNGLEDLVDRFQGEYHTELPKRDLLCQLLFDVALVRFSSGVMQAAGFAAMVSEAVEGFAFDETGKRHEYPNKQPSIGPSLPPASSMNQVMSGDRTPHTSSAADYQLPQ